jgi:hypothetical protein
MVMGRKGKTLFSSDSKLARANWNESKIAQLGRDQMPGFSADVALIASATAASVTASPEVASAAMEAA